jgi:hypothetical protein
MSLLSAEYAAEGKIATLEALHEIYMPRIQRGNASLAANVLGARGAVLAVLAHFFEPGRWGSPAETGVEGQTLTAEDHLYILMQAALYLTVTQRFRSTGSPSMLRARGVSGSFAEPPSPAVLRPDKSVALFSMD